MDFSFQSPSTSSSSSIIQAPVPPSASSSVVPALSGNLALYGSSRSIACPLSIALVCQSNLNRSMEAHKLLGDAGINFIHQPCL